MNDSAIVERLRQIDRLQERLSEILYEIEESDHPRAAELSEALWEQCWFAASAQHIGIEYINPAIWSLRKLQDGGYGGIVSRRWAKAHKAETIDAEAHNA